jgi:hypothetical protein
MRWKMRVFRSLQFMTLSFFNLWGNGIFFISLLEKYKEYDEILCGHICLGRF